METLSFLSNISNLIVQSVSKCSEILVGVQVWGRYRNAGGGSLRCRVSPPTGRQPASLATNHRGCQRGNPIAPGPSFHFRCPTRGSRGASGRCSFLIWRMPPPHHSPSALNLYSVSSNCSSTHLWHWSKKECFSAIFMANRYYFL